MALTPQQLAELQRLKEMYAPLVEAQRRKDQAQANAEKMNVVPPGKADGGSIPSHDVMRLAIGGQGPKNWLKGSLDPVLQPLKINHRAHTPENEAELQAELQDATSRNDQRMLEAVQADMRGMKHGAAINQWIERNLANYIKKQMATHDDPIRKLAEQGIVHMPPEQVGLNRYKAPRHREYMGGEQLGKSEAAQAWEDAADIAIARTNVGNIQGHSNWSEAWEPWMEKADKYTHLHYPSDSMHAHYLGFDHLVDVLKEDLAEGRIRPEQLSKVSIEHAVRRAHEYDQEKKRKMAETALKATEGMPVHKDYGDGFKWIELALPKELPEGYSMSPAGTYVDPEGKQSIHHPGYGKLADAMKYEGDTMGHCVKGESYVSGVAKGEKRIFSLRDAKNEPHVTIEVNPQPHPIGTSAKGHGFPDRMSYGEYSDPPVNIPKETEQQIFDLAKQFHQQRGGADHHKHFQDAADQILGPLPAVIRQIKGKGNAKPKKQYIPFVQDFVKSGKWSDVGDLLNADLYHVHPESDVAKNLSAAGEQVPTYVTNDELTAISKRFKKADGGEVDAETVFMAKGGSTIKQLEKYLRDREGEYGLKRLQRAADEIPGLDKMYTEEALRRAFGGDNAQALMTMNPADFEKFAIRLYSDPDTREEEMNEPLEYVPGLPPMTHHEYIKYLAKIKGGFADVPFLELNKRLGYLPSIEGHEGRHRSRALSTKKIQKSLVQLYPTSSMREPMPRKYREDFIEAMKKELGEKRLVTGEGRSLLPADLEAPEHKNIERRNMLGGRPQLPEIYKDGGEVDAESYFFPNKE